MRPASHPEPVHYVTSAVIFRGPDILYLETDRSPDDHQDWWGKPAPSTVLTLPAAPIPADQSAAEAAAALVTQHTDFTAAYVHMVELGVYDPPLYRGFGSRTVTIVHGIAFDQVNATEPVPGGTPIWVARDTGPGVWFRDADAEMAEMAWHRRHDCYEAQREREHGYA